METTVEVLKDLRNKVERYRVDGGVSYGWNSAMLSCLALLDSEIRLQSETPNDIKRKSKHFDYHQGE